MFVLKSVKVVVLEKAKVEKHWDKFLLLDQPGFRASVVTKLRRLQKDSLDFDGRLLKIERRIFPSSRTVSQPAKRLLKKDVKFFLKVREGAEKE